MTGVSILIDISAFTGAAEGRNNREIKRAIKITITNKNKIRNTGLRL